MSSIHVGDVSIYHVHARLNVIIVMGMPLCFIMLVMTWLQSVYSIECEHRGVGLRRGAGAAAGTSFARYGVSEIKTQSKPPDMYDDHRSKLHGFNLNRLLELRRFVLSRVRSILSLGTPDPPDHGRAWSTKSNPGTTSPQRVRERL